MARAAGASRVVSKPLGAAALAPVAAVSVRRTLGLFALAPRSVAPLGAAH